VSAVYTPCSPPSDLPAQRLPALCPAALRKLLSKGSHPTPGVRFPFPVARKGPAAGSPAAAAPGTQAFSGDLLMLIAGNCRQVGSGWMGGRAGAEARRQRCQQLAGRHCGLLVLVTMRLPGD
jgi:hypothetical protein